MKCVYCKKEQSTRTESQNNALHLWCSQVAKELNESGQPIQLVLSKTMELDWDTYSVKDLLWRKVQKALLHKHSTTELSKQEDITKVWEHLNRFLGEKCKIHVPFPSDKGIEELTGGHIPLDKPLWRKIQ